MKKTTKISWKPVRNYEGLYSISSVGEIRSLKKTWITGRRIVRYKEETVLKPFLKPNGYYHVQLCKNGKAQQYAVHTLLALTFIKNPHNKKCVNHIDGDKLNNDISNLEWATYQENNNHALRTGIRVNPSGANNGYSVQLECYRKDGVKIGLFESIRDAAKKLGLTYNQTWRRVSGEIVNSDLIFKRIYKGKVL